MWKALVQWRGAGHRRRSGIRAEQGRCGQMRPGRVNVTCDPVRGLGVWDEKSLLGAGLGIADGIGERSRASKREEHGYNRGQVNQSSQFYTPSAHCG